MTNTNQIFLTHEGIYQKAYGIDQSPLAQEKTREELANNTNFSRSLNPNQVLAVYFGPDHRLRGRVMTHDRNTNELVAGPELNFKKQVLDDYVNANEHSHKLVVVGLAALLSHVRAYELDSNLRFVDLPQIKRGDVPALQLN